MKNTAYKLVGLVGLVAMGSSSVFAGGISEIRRIERPRTAERFNRFGEEKSVQSFGESGRIKPDATQTGSSFNAEKAETPLVNSCKPSATGSSGAGSTFTLNLADVTTEGLIAKTAETVTAVTMSSMNTPVTSIIVANGAREMSKTLTANGKAPADPQAVEGAAVYYGMVQQAELAVGKQDPELLAAVQGCVKTGACDRATNEKFEAEIVANVKRIMEEKGYDKNLNDEVAACAGSYGVKVGARI